MTPMTTNFIREEFACGCGCGENNISPSLIDRLQDLRNLVARPIVVTSGYRCPKHNLDVGGAPDSTHLKGWAADIFVPNMSVGEVWRLAETIDAFREGGMGNARNFLHLDIRPTRARWSYDANGKVVPFTRPR